MGVSELIGVKATVLVGGGVLVGMDTLLATPPVVGLTAGAVCVIGFSVCLETAGAQELRRNNIASSKDGTRLKLDRFFFNMLHLGLGVDECAFRCGDFQYLA